MLDKTNIAIARKMWEEGSNAERIAAYLDKGLFEITSLLNQFQKGKRPEAKFPEKKEPPKQFYSKPVAEKKDQAPNNMQWGVQEEKKIEKFPDLVDPATVPVNLFMKHQGPQKPPGPEKRKSGRPQGTSGLVASSSRKCPNPGCNNSCRKGDVECAQCYQLSLAGRPLLDNSTQYVGGMMKM